MGLKVKISITASVNSNYVGLSVCKLVSDYGGNTAVPASSFAWSTYNLYIGSFQSCYNEANLWQSYSNSVSPATPFWGQANFDSVPVIKEVVIQGQQLGTQEEINRSPKDFTVSASFDEGVTWTTLLTVTGFTGYTIGQVTRFSLLQQVTIGGNATTRTGEPAEEVAIHHWLTRELDQTVIPDAQGNWTATIWPGNYSLTYFADGFKPVCHGPYLFE